MKNHQKRLKMASSAGFEPTAFRLGGERSILLSYEDIFVIIAQAEEYFKIFLKKSFQICFSNV